MPAPHVAPPPVERIDLLAVCTSPQMMDALRVLMLIGLLFLFMVWAWEHHELKKERAKPRLKAAQGEECKLHARKLKDCPPGSHDDE